MNDFTNKTSNKEVDKKQNENNTKYHLQNSRTDLIIISQDISTYSGTIGIPTIIGLIISEHKWNSSNEITKLSIRIYNRHLNIYQYKWYPYCPYQRKNNSYLTSAK